MSDDRSGEHASGELVGRVETAFRERFGREATHVAAAPGRVNLIGEHIDYNDGFVLPMAIGREVVWAAAVAPEGSRRQATLYSLNLGAEVTLDLEAEPLPRRGDWSDYVAGVMAGFGERGLRVPALQAVVASNVPLGGGLSSSAALEVATATLLESLVGVELAKEEKALLCQQAEHRYAGVPCGIMDQFSSVFGQADHLLLLDCRSRELELIRFDSRQVTVLITHSNVRHELAGGEYAERRAQCQAALGKLGQGSWRDVTWGMLESGAERLTEVERQRARHVVSEIARTTAAAAAIARGDWGAVGELMYESHRSLRDDYEVSCRELDLLVELARQQGRAGGVFGARLTGGGFGGSTVTLVESARADEVSQRLASDYRAATGIAVEPLASRPAAGARVLRRE